MMKITITRVDGEGRQEIAKMNDGYYVAMFMEALIEEANKSGKTQFVLDVDFEEKNQNGKA